MRLTPKQRVLKRYPGTICVKAPLQAKGESFLWRIEYPNGIFRPWEPTAHQAWAAADRKKTKT